MIHETNVLLDDSLDDSGTVPNTFSIEICDTGNSQSMFPPTIGGKRLTSATNQLYP